MIPDFNQRTTSTTRVAEITEREPTEERKMALTSLENRDLTHRAYGLLMSQTPDPKELGNLIDHHHSLLKTGLKRSTKKIESMIAAAKSAGALGCKINGSGGGGIMLAYAPGNESAVAEAIEEAGGIPYRTRIGSGAGIVE